jgi:hypothetical protein
VRLKDFWDGFVQSKGLTGVFQSPESQLKNFYHSGLRQAGIAHSQKMAFRLLVSSNPLLRFRLVASLDLANLGKSSSGIWPFSVSHILGFGHFGNSFSGIWLFLVTHLPTIDHPR